ncbi:MAG: heme-binding protein [Betaproteobacteria bacterium]
MKLKPVLTRDDVARILDHARAEALANQWAVTIAIVDDGGHLLALERGDGAAPVSATIATEKARTSALGRRPSQAYEEMINGGRMSFLSAPLAAMLEGGVPIVVDAQVVGAIGVSGVKSGQDAQIATAGAVSVTTYDISDIGERPAFSAPART